MIAFYPIKPVYSEKIFSGEKTYELRKRLPAADVNYVVIYSTMPVGMVTGYAKVKAFHKNTVSELWKLVHKRAGINECDYRIYFDGVDCACAIELEEVKRFARPFHCSELSEEFTVPQSFCYIDEKIFRKLKKRKAETV